MRADSGPIGGDDTHEFLVLADTGESEVFYDSAILDLSLGERKVNYDDWDECAAIVREWTTPYARTDETHDEARYLHIPEARRRKSRGIEVGQIGKAQVAEDGSSIEADAFIFAPHDRLVSTSTRFWDTSGFSFSIGPSGAKVDFSSIASLVSGGIAFQTVVSGGDRVAPRTEFRVYADEIAARNSVFGEDEQDGEAVLLTAIFENNVSGLAVDAPVDLGGLRVGRVTALGAIVDRQMFGDDKARLAATLAIQPGRLGLGDNAGTEKGLDYLAQRVGEGLRARLVTSSILTGGLKVELTQVDDAPPASIDLGAKPNPIIPTTASDISDVSATAEGLYNRINSLPIEDLMQSAINTLDNISRIAGSDDIRAVPGEVRGLLSDARGLVGSDAVKALPGRLDTLVGEVEAIVTELNQRGAAQQLTDALAAASATAQSIDKAAEGLPDLIAQLNAVAAKAKELPLDQLATQATAVLESADRLIDSDEARAVPGRLRDALHEVGTLVAALNERGAADKLSAALADASNAAKSLDEATKGLPDLVDRLNTVAGKAADLPLDELAQQATALLDSADRLIDTDQARALPGDLSAALEQLRGVLAELRDGGLIDNANATMASARAAANNFSTAAEDLPAILQRAEAVLNEASTTLRGYDAQRGVGRELDAALREVERAAKSVSSLARAIERSPNSLLFGR